MANTELILHIKGSEENKSVPKTIVRAGIAQGQISYSQLIWSPIHAAWKQVRELPQLWPSQKIAPAPTPRPKAAPAEAVPRARPTPRVVPRAGPPVPKVRVQGPGKAIPKVRSQPKPTPQPQVLTPPHDRSLSVIKGLFFASGAAVLIGIAVNYLCVDRPLVSQFGRTPFSSIPVYAHLGAFVQPGALVIHIPRSSALTSANFTGFLAALAHSTPPKPGSDDSFDRVALGSGLTGRYTFSGIAWEQLGRMSRDGNAEKEKNFILDQIDDSTGHPLVAPDDSVAARAQVWNNFVRAFTDS